VRRWGLKRVLNTCRVIATVAILWAPFAQEWWWLFPTLAGMAIGEMAFPLASTHVASHSGGNRVRAFAIVMTVGPSVSLMVTPLLSGGLVELWGLRAPFVAAAVFSVVAIAFFASFAPDGPRSRPADTTTPHAGYRDIVRVRGLPLLMALQFVTFLALGIGTSLLSIYLHDQAGYSEARVAALTAFTAVGSISFATVVARSSWLHQRPLAAVSITCGLAALGYAFFLVPDVLPLVLIGLVLRGGFFAAWPLFSATLGEVTPAAMRPHAYALGEILAGTGFVGAPIVAGLLYTADPRLPLIVAVVVLLPMVLVLARVHVPRAEEEHAA
jgi:MFS family permease